MIILKIAPSSRPFHSSIYHKFWCLLTLNDHELTVNFIILILWFTFLILILWFTFLYFFSFVQICIVLVILNSMWKMVLMEIGLFLTFFQGTEISIKTCGK